jgi:bacteriorhodopsin
VKVYIIWLIGVITWNFAVPGAAPIEDVIVAILLSFLSMALKKFFK